MFLNYFNVSFIQIISIICVSITICLSDNVSSLPTTTTDSCECHLRNFDLCSSHLILLSQPVPMMPPGDVFDRMCAFLNESYQCRQDYLHRCSTPSALVMIQLMTQQNDAAFSSLCSPPEAIHWKNKYSASYYCLQSTKMLCRHCMYDYQAGLEAALVNETTQITGGCCAFNRLVACTSDIILSTCGADALAVSKKIGAIFASSVANNLCRTYPEDSQFCLDLLPPIGTLPKGDHFAHYSQIFGSNPQLSGAWGSMNANQSPPKWTDISSWSKKLKT